MVSLYNESRPGNSFLNRSPSAERFTTAIFSPRRRPREITPQQRPPTQESEKQSRRQSEDVRQQQIVHAVRRSVKKQTSSIWSPHLGYDRRASRYSVWEPPAVWSAEGGITNRRNIQVVLFMVGFVFPFGKLNAVPISPAIPCHLY